MRFKEAQALEQQHMVNLYPPIRMPMVIRGARARACGTPKARSISTSSPAAARVTGLGHCHPKLVETIRRQAETLIHVSNDFYTEPQLALAQRLSSLTGGRCFFCNSGAEANEAAIKLARKHGHKIGGPDKYEIVCALKSFHGRTLATLTATGQPKYQQGNEPLPAGFVHIPYNDVAALQHAVSERTCAVLLEPILGESGVYPTTPEFLSTARALCDRVGAALILDEVQTGVGRTGKMFAYQHYDLRPDIMSLAKGLAGGIPIGAMVAWEPFASTYQPGDHASTFGGSALPGRGRADGARYHRRRAFGRARGRPRRPPRTGTACAAQPIDCRNSRLRADDRCRLGEAARRRDQEPVRRAAACSSSPSETACCACCHRWCSPTRRPIGECRFSAKSSPRSREGSRHH